MPTLHGQATATESRLRVRRNPLSLVLVYLASVSLALPDAFLDGRAKSPVGLFHHASAVAAQRSGSSPRAYLGFDRNVYPGDSALDTLRETFSFAGYWLNIPPGETSNSWRGKREILRSYGFGFLVIFNGRSFKVLQNSHDPGALGSSDASAAVADARSERFPAATIIFLDQEEGGRLLPSQRAYLHAWIDGVNANGFQAGVYCSGVPFQENHGDTIITAIDIRDHAGDRKIVYWIYDDACPPSLGCALSQSPPPSSQSGIPFASIWQFAQSPRRIEVAGGCPSNYNPDGNCYPPARAGANKWRIDLDSASSPDPSHGR